MQSKKTLWILDEGPEMRHLYQKVLNASVEVIFFSTAQEFRKHILEASGESQAQNLLVTELKFSDGNLLELLKMFPLSFRKRLDFFVVSECGHAEEIRACFEERAYDFLAKPCNEHELEVKLARFLNSVERTLPEVSFSTETMCLEHEDGVSINLTAKQQQIFNVLNNARGKTVTRLEIQRKIWKNDDIKSKTFDVHLFNLRNKILPLGIEVVFSCPDRYTLIYRR